MKLLQHRRKIIVALTAASLAATTLYVADTDSGKEHRVETVANARATLPVDLPGLVRDVQRLIQGAPGRHGLVEKIIELLRKYGIDPAPAEQFLKDVEKTTPQRVVGAGVKFLTDHGVAASDIKQVQGLLEQLPQVVNKPSLLGKILQKLGELAAKYWWILPIIIAVAVAVMIFGSSSQGQEQEDRDESGCDRTALDKEWPLISAPGVHVTTGVGFDDSGTRYQFEAGVSRPYQVGGKTYPSDKNWMDLIDRRLRGLGKPTGIKDHAEPKMAIYMSLRKVDHVCMVINHPDGPCPFDANPWGCINAVPLILDADRKQVLDLYWKADGITWSHTPITATRTAQNPAAPLAAQVSPG